jgi:hypothetical protein
MVRRRFDKYEQPNGLGKAYKHFVGHTNSSNSNINTNKRSIGEHELAAGLHKLGFQLTQHQVRVLLKRMSLDSSTSTASGISVSAAEFNVFVRDPYHEDLAKKVNNLFCKTPLFMRFLVVFSALYTCTAVLYTVYFATVKFSMHAMMECCATCLQASCTCGVRCKALNHLQ